MTDDNKELQPITADLIRELRQQGKHCEAEEMLRAHQESLKKGWSRARKQMIYLSNRIRVAKLKKEGICVYCYKNEVSGEHTLCEECLQKKRQYNKTYKRKTK